MDNVSTITTSQSNNVSDTGVQAGTSTCQTEAITFLPSPGSRTPLPERLSIGERTVTGVENKRREPDEGTPCPESLMDEVKLLYSEMSEQDKFHFKRIINGQCKIDEPVSPDSVPIRLTDEQVKQIQDISRRELYLQPKGYIEQGAKRVIQEAPISNTVNLKGLQRLIKQEMADIRSKEGAVASVAKEAINTVMSSSNDLLGVIQTSDEIIRMIDKPLKKIGKRILLETLEKVKNAELYVKDRLVDRITMMKKQMETAKRQKKRTLEHAINFPKNVLAQLENPSRENDVIITDEHGVKHYVLKVSLGIKTYPWNKVDIFFPAYAHSDKLDFLSIKENDDPKRNVPLKLNELAEYFKLFLEYGVQHDYAVVTEVKVIMVWLQELILRKEQYTIDYICFVNQIIYYLEDNSMTNHLNHLMVLNFLVAPDGTVNRKFNNGDVAQCNSNGLDNSKLKKIRSKVFKSYVQSIANPNQKNKSLELLKSHPEDYEKLTTRLKSYTSITPQTFAELKQCAWCNRDNETTVCNIMLELAYCEEMFDFEKHGETVNNYKVGYLYGDSAREEPDLRTFISEKDNVQELFKLRRELYNAINPEETIPTSVYGVGTHQQLANNVDYYMRLGSAEKDGVSEDVMAAVHLYNGMTEREKFNFNAAINEPCDINHPEEERAENTPPPSNDIAAQSARVLKAAAKVADLSDTAHEVSKSTKAPDQVRFSEDQCQRLKNYQKGPLHEHPEALIEQAGRTLIAQNPNRSFESRTFPMEIHTEIVGEAGIRTKESTLVKEITNVIAPVMEGSRDYFGAIRQLHGIKSVTKQHQTTASDKIVLGTRKRLREAEPYVQERLEDRIRTVNSNPKRRKIDDKNESEVLEIVKRQLVKPFKDDYYTKVLDSDQNEHHLLNVILAKPESDKKVLMLFPEYGTRHKEWWPSTYSPYLYNLPAELQLNELPFYFKPFLEYGVMHDTAVEVEVKVIMAWLNVLIENESYIHKYASSVKDIFVQIQNSELTNHAEVLMLLNFYLPSEEKVQEALADPEVAIHLSAEQKAMTLNDLRDKVFSSYVDSVIKCFNKNNGPLATLKESPTDFSKFMDILKSPELITRQTFTDLQNYSWSKLDNCNSALKIILELAVFESLYSYVHNQQKIADCPLGFFKGHANVNNEKRLRKVVAEVKDKDKLLKLSKELYEAISSSQ